MPCRIVLSLHTDLFLEECKEHIEGLIQCITQYMQFFKDNVVPTEGQGVFQTTSPGLTKTSIPF